MRTEYTADEAISRALAGVAIYDRYRRALARDHPLATPDILETTDFF